MFNKNDAIAHIEQNKEFYCKLSDEIWNYAELAFKEFRSAGALMAALRQEGFSVEEQLVKGIPTSFKGVWGHGRPIIAILGEFDALAGLSQEGGVARRQQRQSSGDAMDTEAGHGCGHNCLGAGALAGAVAVKHFLENNPGMSGTIIYFGCPGEEGLAGKAHMAGAGCFDGIDCALTWHPYGTNNIFSGSTLATASLIFKFKGIAAHASVAPHLGRSALDGAELMNVGIQFLREHMPMDARIHYAFLDAGGKAPNVVQERTVLKYMIRAPHMAQVMELVERVIHIAQGAALMTDTQMTYDYYSADSEQIPNAVLERVLQNNLEAIGVPAYTVEERAFAASIVSSYELPHKAMDLAANLSPQWKRLLEQHYNDHGVGINDFVLPYQHWDHPIPASTDVGDVSWNCPTAMFFAQCAAAKIPEHSWQYVACNNTSLAHKGLIYAGKVLAGAAIDLLTDPELVVQARALFDANLQGKKYQCPLTPGQIIEVD